MYGARVKRSITEKYVFKEEAQIAKEIKVRVWGGERQRPGGGRVINQLKTINLHSLPAQKPTEEEKGPTFCAITIAKKEKDRRNI